MPGGELPRARREPRGGDPVSIREARVFTRYLLAADCPAEMAERYARGSRLLFAADAPAAARAVLDFARDHPWSLPFLDAAGAFSPAGALLRRRLLLMTAVLEASPRFAHEFLSPRRRSGSGTVLRLVWYGASAGLKALLGAPLLWWLTARAR